MRKLLLLLGLCTLAGCGPRYTPDGEIQTISMRGKDAYYADYHSSRTR